MRLLVVGCGSIGRRHAVNGAAFADAGVFDDDLERAKAAGEAAGAEVFDTLDAALAWGPDGVIVATPHSSHIAVAKAAVRAGADVLVEKPISHRREGVDEFLEEAQRAGRHVHVVCNMRYHAAVRALRENLHAIGKPLYARAHYGNYLPNMRPNADYRELYCASRAAGGGVILDAIHEIDYLSWFFGAAHTTSASAGRISNLDIDVEDYAVIALSHTWGVRSLLNFDYLRPRKSRGCEIVGTDGILDWHSDGKKPEHCRVRLYTADGGEWRTLLDEPDFDDSGCYREMMADFVNAIEGGPSELLDGRNALHELNVALNALERAGLIKDHLPEPA